MADWHQVTVVHKTVWNDTLFTISLDLNAGDFKAGQFVKLGLDVNGERIERAYSLVNAPNAATCDILFNIVPEGPLTPRLAALGPNDTIWIKAPPQGLLILETVPTTVKDLWLMATGTGLGPFVAMLRDGALERFDKIILVHGVRSCAELAYRDELEKLQQQHPATFSYLPVISRETETGLLSGRITTCLTDGTLERQAGQSIHPATSHLMLCGNINMIRDVQELLAPRGIKKHKRGDPGHITMEKYH